MKIAVVGATGLVGQTMLQVLTERQFPITKLYAVASQKSVGKEISVNDNTLKVIDLDEAVNKDIDIALFSAGGSVSKEWAPKFAAKGTFVVDNSSAWRMDESKKLIVPEINANTLRKDDKIIANPNCSTIQMVLPLYTLHRKYKIKRIVVSTYQSVSGSGIKAMQQMNDERLNKKTCAVYPHEIDLNCFPHGGDFLDNGYTTEEEKLLNETRKIFDDYSVNVSATVVRVPVLFSHSEAVNIEFENDYDINELKTILANTKGVIVYDEPSENKYPTAKYVAGKDEIFVGRIRRDYSQANSLNLWIVGDNIRKGAATNAVQIAEYIYREFFN